MAASTEILWWIVDLMQTVNIIGLRYCAGFFFFFFQLNTKLDIPGKRGPQLKNGLHQFVLKARLWDVFSKSIIDTGMQRSLWGCQRWIGGSGLYKKATEHALSGSAFLLGEPRPASQPGGSRAKARMKNEYSLNFPSGYQMLLHGRPEGETAGSGRNAGVPNLLLGTPSNHQYTARKASQERGCGAYVVHLSPQGVYMPGRKGSSSWGASA